MASKKNKELTAIYHVGGVYDGMICITEGGPQAAVDIYFNQTGDKKSVEVYEFKLAGHFKGKKMSKEKLKRLIVM